MDPDSNTPPQYPSDAIQRGQEGTVLLTLSVTPDGTIDGGTVTQSSGYRSLDIAALNASEKWHFRGGPYVFNYAVHFSLNHGASVEQMPNNDQ